MTAVLTPRQMPSEYAIISSSPACAAIRDMSLPGPDAKPSIDRVIQAISLRDASDSVRSAISRLLPGAYGEARQRHVSLARVEFCLLLCRRTAMGEIDMAG